MIDRFISKYVYNTLMTLKNQEIEKLIEKSKSFGFKEVPTNSESSEIVLAMIQVIKANSEKFWTAKECEKLFESKSRKYFSDTLWGLREKKILSHVQRGVYKWNAGKDNPEL